MNRRRERKKESGLEILSIDDLNDGKNRSESDQVSRIEILIHDVQSGSSDRQSQKRRDHRHASPARLLIRKASADQPQAAKQKEKNRSDLPKEEHNRQRQMTNSHRGRNEVREKRQLRMRFEKLRVEWKQLGMQDCLGSREIKRRVFRPRMVAVNQQCSQSKEPEQKEIPEFQTKAPRMASTLSTI